MRSGGRLFWFFTALIITTTTAFLAKPVVATISDRKAKDSDAPDGDFIQKLGPLAFVPTILFVGQICFLAVAKGNSGLENLEVYGDLGNQYIRSHDGYNPSKSFIERQRITQEGQKVWLDNVVRDLQNGGPVKPPLSEPLP